MLVEIKSEILFHVSEDPNIKVFHPRPSPSYFENVKSDVVFAIADSHLHNYLLPRDCPRVAYFAKQGTTQEDRNKFIGSGSGDFVIAVEQSWLSRIETTILYCYVFRNDSFIELDKSAGYYVSYSTVTPLEVRLVNNIGAGLLKRNVELRVMPSIVELAIDVSKSTLEFSLIRMRNAVRHHHQL